MSTNNFPSSEYVKPFEKGLIQGFSRIKPYMKIPGLGSFYTKDEVEKLLKFCSLDWDENCLAHHKNKRVIKTISFNQARRPIYNTSLKSYAGYEKYLTDLMDLA